VKSNKKIICGMLYTTSGVHVSWSVALWSVLLCSTIPIFADYLEELCLVLTYTLCVLWDTIELRSLREQWNRHILKYKV